MSKMAEGHHTEHKQVGRSFDGSVKLTISLIVALVLLVSGVLLTVYLGFTYGLIFGLPLVLIGLALPIVVQFGFAGKKD